MNTERATTYFPSLFKSDFLASVVVFLVALPLCMGISIASGVGPAAGLITGIIGGLVVGSVSGSPLQVSGPAAGLTVMVYEIIQRDGLAALGPIVLLAGAVQIVAGILGFGQWFRAVSPAVIKGMLAGIGVLIFGSQFHVMVDDAPRGSGLQNLIYIPEAILKGVVPNDDSTHHWAAMSGLLTILIMIMWKPLVPRKLKMIPAPLVAVSFATVIAWAMSWPVIRIDLPDQLFTEISLPAGDQLARLLNGEIMLAALALAFVASAETLLCATAVDQMHTGVRTRYDRELMAQGGGNMLCGLLGALPMTGVIVRSSANIEAGGKTRMSAIMHGAWLLLFILFLSSVLRLIPTSSLAAMLVYTGYKLVDIKSLRRLSDYGRGEVAIYIATVVMIVVSGLLTGVLVGVALSVAKLLYAFTHLELKLTDVPDENRTELRLRGAATFIRLPAIAVELGKVRPSTELHVRFENLTYIDHACLDLLMNWEKQHEATGGRLIVDWDDLHGRFRPTREGEGTDDDDKSGEAGKRATPSPVGAT